MSTRSNRFDSRWHVGVAVVMSATAVLAVSACSSARRLDARSPYSSDNGAPLPATAPHLLMRDGAVGLAVWPSAHSWLLLGTTDGWKHVENRTPIAVPTGGGLVAAASADSVVVAIGAYERLSQSPLLTGATTGAWRPSELPGTISNARGAVSTTAGHVSAVLAGAGGTVVVQTGSRWTRLTGASSLAPGGGLRLDAVTWASETLGWVTGHGRAGAPVAFQTTDAGRSWTALRHGTAVAALAPCGNRADWLLPVISGDGTVRVDHTTDGGKTWTTGAPVRLSSGPPAWGCRESQVWMAGRGRGNRVFASNDAGATWLDAGAAPPGLTDLSPTGDGTGFAASTSSHGPMLWSVTSGGARFTSLELPGWVATIGSQMTDS